MRALTLAAIAALAIGCKKPIDPALAGEPPPRVDNPFVDADLYVNPAYSEKVLASRPLTYAADGMLYRELLAEAAAEQGLEVRRYARKTDPTQLAAEALGVDVAEVTALVARFGKEAGAPWRKDHKLAATAALSVLGARIRNKP